jgi:uncharacterized protein YqeY
VSESILERIQGDTREAMKAGRKDRVSTLRMITSALQQDEKEGARDAVAVLQRERKKRLEAATAYSEGGRAEQAEAERSEAELIAEYLPEQISDDELVQLVDEAIAATGASSPADMGKVMGAVMPAVKGKADGNRVSATVKERLSTVGS